MFFRNLVIFAFPVNFPGLIPTPVAAELDDLAERLGLSRSIAVRMVADERRAGRSGQQVSGLLRLRAMDSARPTTTPPGAA